MQLPRIQDYRDVNHWAGELVRRLELAQGARVLASRLVAGTNVDLTYDANLQTITFDAAVGSGGSPTDLSYTAGTRLLSSSTGTDVTLPLFGAAAAGLTPASGGGTSNYLRADGTWATPPGGGGGGGGSGNNYFPGGWV
jgi:hypothetical protein